MEPAAEMPLFGVHMDNKAKSLSFFFYFRERSGAVGGGFFSSLMFVVFIVIIISFSFFQYSFVF